jgi:hypothetical protein
MPAHYEIEPYDPCPCGSGKKYKFCCAGKKLETSHGKYPIGTVAYYGPDDKTTTKIAAGVIASESAEPVMQRWVGDENIAKDEKVADEIKRFFAEHGVKSVVVTDGVLGCPHEEGIDFPLGQECPFCPFWNGKQGIRPRNTELVDIEEIDDLDAEFDEEEDEDFDDEEEWDEDEDDDADEEDRDWDAQFARVDAILGDKRIDMGEAVDVLLTHLQANLQLPCEVTGIEDFRWEEPYVFGAWPQAEYRQLKKTQPSYRDRFELLSLDRDEISEWMMMPGEDIAARVRRKSDGKEFVLGLSELKATDKKSPNYQLLDDYAVWLVNNR